MRASREYPAMNSHGTCIGSDYIERLESRRLLSLTPIGTETTVPFPIEMSQFDLAVAGDGSFIVVADPIEQPGSPDVIAVRYAANGEQLGAPLRLDDRGFNVSVSMDADGDAVVVYQKGRDGVYVVRVSKAGVATAPQRVGTAPPAQSIYETSVSMDDAGGFFVAWLQRNPQFYPVTVQMRAFDASGQPRGPQFVAASGDSTNVKYAIDVAALPEGAGAVLVYSNGHDNGTSLAFQRLDTQGIVGPVGFVASIGPYTALGLEGDVAAHHDGSFVVGYGRLVKRFDAMGTLVGGPVLIGASIPTIPTDTLVDDVTVDAPPDGGFVAGFVLDRGGAVTTYAEHFSPTGLSTNGAVVVDTGGARSPVIGAGGADRAVIAYLQSDGGSGDVHVRRLTLADLAELRGGELFVTGTAGNDHIIIERVRDRLWVNVNGIVEGFNAADVQFLSISGLGGDDDVVDTSGLQCT
ncbi:MAG TPA: hypothetical protein VGR35_00370, partial [Tepidisphaeraceae bacterium]|nr:hypothetical protein [Tepidisphaeraceae bacterium]